MRVYYNEIDPNAAAWLRELVNQGHLPQGDVDERDIRDVKPNDLAGYVQCHFFAGIGGWSLALRLAGWPVERPVWTGSCPCQPFSTAGARGGVSDERHLWPHWHHLIRECRPPEVFGEQVASKDGLGWLDLVSADLEGEGYAVGASDLCAAGIGAPHIRQRLWFYARAERLGNAQNFYGGNRAKDRGLGCPQQSVHSQARQGAGETVGVAGGAGGLANADNAGPQGRGEPGRERAAKRSAGPGGVAGRLANACGERRQQVAKGASGDEAADGSARQGGGQPHGDNIPASDGEDRRPSPTDGFWRDADWLFCRDGKWRPVEPGTFPLAHGLPARVGRLRGYGNAIVPQVAATFITAAMAEQWG